MKPRTGDGSGLPPTGAIATGRTGDPGADSARCTIGLVFGASSCLTGGGFGGSAMRAIVCAVRTASSSAGSLGWEIRAHWIDTGDETATAASDVAAATGAFGGDERTGAGSAPLASAVVAAGRARGPPGTAEARCTTAFGFNPPAFCLTGGGFGGSDMRATVRVVLTASCSDRSLGWEIRAHWMDTADEMETAASDAAGATAGLGTDGRTGVVAEFS